MMREAKGWIFETIFFLYKKFEPIIKKLRAKKWQQKRKTGDNEVKKNIMRMQTISVIGDFVVLKMEFDRTECNIVKWQH
jgi:hypothetical protein